MRYVRSFERIAQKRGIEQGIAQGIEQGLAQDREGHWPGADQTVKGVAPAALWRGAGVGGDAVAGGEPGAVGEVGVASARRRGVWRRCLR